MPSAGALRAGRAVIEMGLNTEGVQSGLDKLQLSLKRFGQSLQSIGKQAFNVGKGITDVFTKAVTKFTNLGSQLQDASVRTGVSVEALSALKFAAEQSGASFENLEKGIRFLQKSGGDASVASIMRIADELAAISDPSNRAQKSMKLFGKFAGPELLPLLSIGSGGLKQLMDQARLTGNVMSGETAMAAEQLGDAFDVVKTQLATLLVNIATAISGDLQKFTDSIIEITRRIIHWTKEHQSLIKVVAISGVSLLAFGTVSILVGKTLIGLSVAIEIVRTALTLLAKHPYLAIITLSVIAVGELTGAFDFLASKIDEVVGAGEDEIARLADEFKKMTKEAKLAGDEMSALDSIDVKSGIDLAARFKLAGNSAAAVGQRSTDGIFDTRLANQIFGKQSSRIEDEQLRVQRQIERNTRQQPNPGIPVIP